MVGTHEQQFDRLVKAVDELVENGSITESVFIQMGYCNYEPKHCDYARFLPYECMVEHMKKADIVITHGGPSSFIEAMAAGKVPVVVPRMERLGEHINNHQADFVCKVAERKGGIVPCYDIERLADAIQRARSISGEVVFKSHNRVFCQKLQKIIEGL